MSQKLLNLLYIQEWGGGCTPPYISYAHMTQVVHGHGLDFLILPCLQAHFQFRRNYLRLTGAGDSWALVHITVNSFLDGIVYAIDTLFNDISILKSY